jgi:hypothetical protein
MIDFIKGLALKIIIALLKHKDEIALPGCEWYQPIAFSSLPTCLADSI